MHAHVESMSKFLVESLSHLPYLIMLEALRCCTVFEEAGQALRLAMQQVGVLQLMLQCLSLASHHSPRVDGEGDTTHATSSEVISLEDQ